MISNEPIIIVDDDADDHSIFEDIAQRLKLSNPIKFFNNALDALEYLKTTTDKPFIIFCDINMPHMDGLSFRKAINQDPDLRRKSIPFVFFSTAASKAQIVQAYDLTVQGFFIKESSFAQIEKTFKLILDYWDKCRHPNSFNDSST